MHLDDLVPEARDVVGNATEVYVRHTSPYFVGLVVHGSTVKGDFIAGGSDIDFMLYLEDGAFDATGGVQEKIALATHSALSSIDVAPFRFLQCFPKRTRLVPGDPFQEVGPYPGTYTLVEGRLPVPEATAEQVHERAIRQLRALPDAPYGFTNGLFSYGDQLLAVQVSALRSTVWSAFYAALTVLAEDPLSAWPVGKPDAVALAPEDLRTAMGAFLEGQLAYYGGNQSTESGLAMARTGLASLRAIKATTVPELV